MAFVGTTSQVSSSDTDGRLMFASDKSVLWHVGSTMSYPVGGRFGVHSHTSHTPLGTATRVSAITQRMHMEVGVATLKTASATTTVNFSTTFVHTPALFLSPGYSVVSLVDIPITQGAASSSFQLTNYKLTSGASGAPAANYDVQYMAFGVVAG